MNSKRHTSTIPFAPTLALGALVFAIGLFGYGWHRVVSAQNGANSSDSDRPQLFNGQIIFQRGSVSKPFYNGATLFTVNPFTGNETSFGAGSEPSYSYDGTKVVFLKSSQLFFGDANDYSSAKGLVVPNGGSAEIGLYPKISPDNSQILYQSTTSVGGTLLYHTYIINTACILDNNQYRDTNLCSVTELNPGGTNAYLFPTWMPVEGTAGSNRVARIAYVRTSNNKADVDADNYTGQIFIEDLTIAPNGTVTEGQKTQLTITAAKYAFLSYDPSGLKTYLEQDGGIYWESADNSSNPRPVVTTGSTDPISGHRPVISPDGSKIAFDNGFSLSMADLAIMGDGSTFANNITDVPVNSANFDLFPSWQPVSTPLSTPTPTPTPATLPKIPPISVTGPTSAGGSITLKATTDPGLAVRAQSSNSTSCTPPPTTPQTCPEGSWTDLGNGGGMSEATAGNYSLTTAAYPITDGLYFRAISSKSGFADGKSDAKGPYNLKSLPPLLLAVTGPATSGGSISFAASTTYSGLNVRIQWATCTSNCDPTKLLFTDLPNGGQMHDDGLGIYSFVTANYPIVNGVYFRAIASKTGFNDAISNVSTAFNLGPPAHGGLSNTVFTVNESFSPQGNLADTVLRFAAAQTSTAAGLKVRVLRIQRAVGPIWITAAMG